MNIRHLLNQAVLWSFSDRPLLEVISDPLLRACKEWQWEYQCVWLKMSRKKNMLSLLTQMVLEIVVFLVFPRYSHVQTNPLHIYGVFQIILKWSKGVTETSQYSRFSNKLQTFSKFCGRGFENRLYIHRSKALVVKVIHFLSPWLLKLENSCSFILCCHSAESQVRTNVKIFTSIPSSYETSPLYGPKKV